MLGTEQQAKQKSALGKGYGFVGSDASYTNNVISDSDTIKGY